MKNVISNILQDAYVRVAQIAIKDNISSELMLNQIRLSQNEMLRNAFETVSFSNSPECSNNTTNNIDSIIDNMDRILHELLEDIDRDIKRAEERNIEKIDNTIQEEKDDIIWKDEEDNIEETKIFYKSRWPETSKTALRYKTKMEELYNKAENDPFNSEFPNTKREICEYCEINFGCLGDFKNWLKKYHNEFYNNFIDNFPGFSGRSD